MNYRWIPCSLLAVGLFWVAACDDPGGGETGATASTGSQSTGVTEPSPTTMSTAPGTTGGITPSPGDSSGSSGSDDDTGVDGSEGSTSTTAEPTSSSSGTGPGACEGLDRAACMADPACMAIGGSPIEMRGDGVCWGEREFVECQPAAACGDAISYGCEDQDATMYQFPDTCLPQGWIECIPPPVDIPPCS